MSSQDQPGVAFGIAHEQHTVRLLELPADLLDLICAPNPPRLSIKSGEALSSDNVPTGKPSYAVLCTPNKTYQIRQVQTSNSVFVTQSSTSTDDVGLPIDGINAIASCTATLELHAVTESASNYLKVALITWDEDSSTSKPRQNGQSKHSILKEIPLSDGECEVSWAQLCAFEHNGRSYMPTAGALVSLWKDVLEVSIAESIDLSQMFLVDELWKVLDSQTMSSTPKQLLNALLCRLLPDSEQVNQGWARVDQSKTVHWVGAVTLEAESDENLLTAEFLDRWRNSLPEKWRELAQLEAIQGLYSLPTSTNIAWAASQAPKDPGGASKSTATSAASGARKWHEKFKSARK